MKTAPCSAAAPPLPLRAARAPPSLPLPLQGYFQPDVGGKNIPVAQGELSDLAGDEPLFKALYKWCVPAQVQVHRQRWLLRAGPRLLARRHARRRGVPCVARHASRPLHAPPAVPPQVPGERRRVQARVWAQGVHCGV